MIETPINKTAGMVTSNGTHFLNRSKQVLKNFDVDVFKSVQLFPSITGQKTCGWIVHGLLARNPRTLFVCTCTRCGEKRIMKRNTINRPHKCQK